MKRTKKRYLALLIETQEIPSRREIANLIWGAISKLYGECGASLTNLSLIDYDTDKKIAVIRISLESVNIVKASLASITKVADQPAAVHVIAVSGTLRSILEKV